jgi:hypothetical protein
MTDHQNYHSMYITLQKSGMFWEWFPNMTGIWSQDADSFIDAVNVIQKYNMTLQDWLQHNG